MESFCFGPCPAALVREDGACRRCLPVFPLEKRKSFCFGEVWLQVPQSVGNICERWEPEEVGEVAARSTEPSPDVLGQYLFLLVTHGEFTGPSDG